MSPKEFFDKVSRMRKAQKEYFRTRSGRALADSKRLEKEIDDEIERARLYGRKCARVIACVNHDANAILSHAANHECDEVMFLFDFALGQGPTLFFEPNKYTD